MERRAQSQGPSLGRTRSTNVWVSSVARRNVAVRLARSFRVRPDPWASYGGVLDLPDSPRLNIPLGLVALQGEEVKRLSTELNDKMRRRIETIKEDQPCATSPKFCFSQPGIPHAARWPKVFFAPTPGTRL